MPDDVTLVSRVALLGDRNAFNQLVVAYQSPIRRFFLNLTGGDEELSKDLAQDTFVKAWLNIASFRAAAKFSTWLYRIAYNTFYDHARSRKHTGCLDDASMPEPVSTEATNSDRNMDFARALKILNGDERTVMLLFYMEDQPIKKISQIMNCPAGTIKSHLFRGKEKLSAYFKNSGYDQ